MRKLIIAALFATGCGLTGAAAEWQRGVVMKQNSHAMPFASDRLFAQHNQDTGVLGLPPDTRFRERKKPPIGLPHNQDTGVLGLPPDTRFRERKKRPIPWPR
jgi:hypothetical protein